MSGKGTYFYKNGDVYEGEWQLDRREGMGKMIYANGKIEEGKWMKDEFVGK